MRMRKLYINSQRRSGAAKAGGTNAGLVDKLQQLVLKLSIALVLVMVANIASQRIFCEDSSTLHIAANAYANGNRRAGVRACSTNGINNKFFDAFHTVSRLEHFQSAHVLAAAALRAENDMHLVARNNFGMNNSRSIVAGILAFENRVTYRGFTQIAFGIAFSYAGMHCFVQITANEVYLLADFQENNSQTGILAQRHSLLLSQLKIFYQRSQNLAAKRRFLSIDGVFDFVHHLLRQIIAGIHT